ncbi:PREDICTED: sex comb on midleg-like protein 1 [Tinamus guttatus]|uniref:sex comb on midleg-like protein 1 n=1 Tax=Tinamus guttatus TaxID=94827 RepID=UPI00052EB24F|nr:PREDICTED: sex comb on midleg-like protein 1 [Tinamus guttatus]
MSHSASMQRGNAHNPEKMDYVFSHNKRKRFAPTLVRQNVMRTEGEYEESDSVIYEYEPDYECGSIVSEASYTGDLQKTLMEVLSYCQAMYDAIQKLDKKFDLLHQKVSEMQHTRVKPLLLKPRPVGFAYRSSSHLPQGKIGVPKSMDRESSLHLSSPGQGRHSPVIRVALQKGHVQVNSIKRIQQTLQLESQQPVLRQSPPLPTIVSTHSLHSPYTATNGIPDLSALSSVKTTVVESTVNIAASPGTSSVMTPSSETSLENNGVQVNYRDRSGNVSKELPSSSVSINPSFEFLAANFPNYDLSEYGKDWKTCITNVNAMIRCLRSETKIRTLIIKLLTT